MPGPDAIDRFEGKWAALAMDHPHPIPAKHGLPDAPSVEHALLAAKTHDRDAQRKILTTGDIKQARALALRTPARHNWHEIELRTLRYLLDRKFEDSECAELLRETGDAFLIDGACGNDYWGMVNDEGTNHHGLLLMEVRAELCA